MTLDHAEKLLLEDPQFRELARLWRKLDYLDQRALLDTARTVATRWPMNNESPDVDADPYQEAGV